MEKLFFFPAFTKYFAQNFNRFGIKKLISTSYAPKSKLHQFDYQPSLFESDDPQFDQSKTLRSYGQIWCTELSSVFVGVEPELRGLEWGRLYKTYKDNPYDPLELDRQVKELYTDPYVNNHRGVFEYLLGGSTDSKLLDVRVFDSATKNSTYAKQTKQARENETSNCPLCAVGDNNNKTRIYKFKDMDADHVTAWSRGGTTTADNCQMLCVTHNRAKGNR